MSRAESHEVGGEGKEAGSWGVGDGWSASHWKGGGEPVDELDDGDVGLSFKVMVRSRWRHTPVTSLASLRWR